MRDGWCRRRPAGLWAWAVLAIGIYGAPTASAAPPVVAGVHQRQQANAPEAELGQLLLGELNCTACHKADAAVRVEAKGAPDLSHAGARLTPQYLRAYLADPHGVKPGATMPDVFHASEAAAKQGAVDFLTHYLVSLGGPMKPSQTEGNRVLVAKGRDLHHTVGCVACHAPEKALDTRVPSVPIGPQALKTTVEALTAFLVDPLSVRPHGRMPSLNLNREEAQTIAVYLLRDQLENPQTIAAAPARTQGLAFSYFPNAKPSDASLETFESLTEGRKGTVPAVTVDIPGRREKDRFAIRFGGVLAAPADGKYTFSLASDDGARLYINGREIIRHDGVHPATEKSGTIELKAGDHPIVVTYYEVAGGEEIALRWEGPGIEKQEVPAAALSTLGGRPMVPLESETFVVDPQKAQMGGRMFAMLGCVNCHAVEGVQGARPAKAMADLDLDSPQGCLAPQPRKGVPKYDLAADQRAAIVAAVKDAGALAEPFEPAERVVRTASQMNCYACHVRDDAGGVTGGVGPDRKPLFVMTEAFDMGDEGRIPPTLTGVGAKLKPEAMAGIIFRGEHHVRRGRMATRMPRFSEQTAGNLVEALAKADAPAKEHVSPAFDERIARDGRLLVGTKGLGCVNCHGVAEAPSLGMPSVNLSTSHARLKPGWFHGLLLDPNKLNPGTRMPAFWYDGAVAYKDVAGGTADGQIAAIWQYLSQGEKMPLPAGLQPKNLELIPVDEPIVHRTFMAEVGTRAVLVGYPDNLHVAFDANVVRLAKAWKGRFYDASGMWEGRGGKQNPPLGTDVLDLPAGPSFATLAAPDAPWPRPDKKDRDVGGQFRGYLLDKLKQPIFCYETHGVTVQEKDFPLLQAAGPVLVRKFQLDEETFTPPQNLHFLAATGGKIEPGKEAGEWVVDDKLRLKFSPNTLKPTVRGANGRKELILPITFDLKTVTFEVEMKW